MRASRGPRLVVNNVAPAVEACQSINPSSGDPFPLPDFVFQPLRYDQWSLPRQLRKKGRYTPGGAMGTSVGFI